MMCNKPLTIAIDGPAGAGKSTIAKALSSKLGIMHLDTGSMYRAAGLKAVRLGIDRFDTERITRMIAQTDIDVRFSGGEQFVYLDGENVTGLIRTQEISKAASDIGTNKSVRVKMVELQQAIAARNSVIMDGRDIGTDVLPNASFKFYVTASAAVRAQRRYADLQRAGNLAGMTLAQLEAEIIERDRVDMSREHSPLVCASDAILVDTSLVGVEETLEYILGFIKGKAGK
ncbi:MAG: (d)CMP kinase [Clostridia bacterium]|nr:(d)CMP kinase [Clostridia bacterium]